MSTTDKRNHRVSEILESFYNDALNGPPVDESVYRVSLDKIFSTDAWGFREILLVVVIGMFLNKEYNASKKLYDCNPRAIYEGPIKDFLIDKNIPHRKSGPLNVAKATLGLDMTWAAQRRPADVAEEVVNIVHYMESEERERENRVKNVAISLLRRLISNSNKLMSLSVDIKPSSDPEYLYNLCFRLVSETPDSGNTPQKIAAFLLKNYHQSLLTGIVVTGVEDRASVTSTTSKKPGDINEETSDGIILKTYEITVKKFDLARIRDSYDCVTVYNQKNKTNIREVIVICREEDCPHEINRCGLQGYLGSYIYQDITYYFWGIYEWIANTLQRMTYDGRISFYNNLNSYIDGINTSENVKKLWRKLHIES